MKNSTGTHIRKKNQIKKNLYHRLIFRCYYRLYPIPLLLLVCVTTLTKFYRSHFVVFVVTRIHFLLFFRVFIWLCPERPRIYICGDNSIHSYFFLCCSCIVWRNISLFQHAHPVLFSILFIFLLFCTCLSF